MSRTLLRDFALANPIYIGGKIYIYTVDANGDPTTTLATLYESFTGSATLPNPQRCDSEGKFAQPVYHDVDVVAIASGLSVPDHQTGVISANNAPATVLYSLVKPAANIVNPTLPYTIAWDEEIADAQDMHDNAVNNSRLTTPDTAQLVRCTCHLELDNVAVDSAISVTIYKNGSAVYNGKGIGALGKNIFSNPVLHAQTSLIIPGVNDYFEARLGSDDTTIDIVATGSWFQLEVLA